MADPGGQGGRSGAQHGQPQTADQQAARAGPGGVGAALEYRDSSGVLHRHPLEGDGPVTIGRGPEVDVSLPWDPNVSSLHAEARCVGGHWVITDEGISRNGTFVNGDRLSGRRRIRHGDAIRVGHTTLAFADAKGRRRESSTVVDTERSISTRTFVFTDLVGSTELMARLGDDAADRLREEHFAALREACSLHRGEQVKSMGDGLMLAFTSALGAVSAAAVMHQRTAAHRAKPGEEPLALRIGVSSGEASSVEGDYFGTPVVVAKRLCDRAGPGQTLVSDVVRWLVGTRGGCRFTSLGPVRLKGIAEPVSVFELDWDDVTPTGDP